MKQLLLPALLLLLVCCKKEDNPPSILGTWELRREVSPWWDQRYSPGNDTLLKFTANRYEHSIGGQVKRQGTYRLVKDIYLNNEKGNRIIYDGNTNDARDFYRIRDNELSFMSDPNLMDGGVSYYQRVE